MADFIKSSYNTAWSIENDVLTIFCDICIQINIIFEIWQVNVLFGFYGFHGNNQKATHMNKKHKYFIIIFYAKFWFSFLLKIYISTRIFIAFYFLTYYERKIVYAKYIFYSKLEHI